jgi:CRP/FNR family transcriptional regulator, cyclic AMP receptor protein
MPSKSRERSGMKYKILDGLTAEEAAQLLQLCREKKYEDGTCLFTEKGKATTLYLIVKGCIELRFELPGKRQAPGTIITSLRPGEAVGWSTMVPPYRYSLSGYCRGETVVLEVDEPHLTRLFQSDYRIGFFIMRNLTSLIGERLYRIEDALAKCLGEELLSEW